MEHFSSSLPLRSLAASIVIGIVVLTGSTSANATSTAPVASEQTAANVAHVGFLSDYDKLAPMPGGDGMLCWKANNTNWKAYDKVLIERIQVYIKPDSTPKPIDPTDLKTLIDYFNSALVKALQPDVQLVTSPGPGVLRVKLALTELIPTNAAKSWTGTIIPYGFVAEMGDGKANGLPSGATPYMGQTGMEAQFLDGVTGNVVGECADTEIGLKYAADLNNGASGAASTWLSGYTDSFSSWNYAKGAFDKWSGEFAQKLAALQGNSANP